MTSAFIVYNGVIAVSNRLDVLTFPESFDILFLRESGMVVSGVEA